MSSDSSKRIWRLYTDLKIWAESHDATSKRFIVKDNSIENPELLSSLQSNNIATASTMQTKFFIIVGLIYPSTDPFKKHLLEVEIRVPFTYPQEPPEVYMRTSIRHPNIEKNGKLCSARLDAGKKWDGIPLANVVILIIDLIDKPERSHVVDGGRLLAFDDPDQCIDHITDELITKRVFLIASNALGQHVVSLIYEISYIQAVYIYCKKPMSNRTLLDKIRDNVGVCNTNSDLSMNIFHLAKKENTL
ncbi:unnamed protein product [Rotaria sordida]|uniref:UBC core domain-containing protein n=1 Tax=Rotaria sordida TaxID=392033 RepID=A0A815DG23_9BILA|nr:unnamed protein product [Rotaria sordida]CAF4017411.1 unnamed protein product [Rotaria sordida]